MHRSPDQRILTAARSTAGVVNSSILTSAGVAPATLRRRVRAGFVTRVSAGLYVVPLLTGPETNLWIAQLGTGGAISHQSALRFYGVAIPGRTTHVLVPKGSDNRTPGTTVHETRLWSDDDVVTVNGLKVTTPARSLIDSVGNLRERRWTNAAQQLLLDGRVDRANLVETFERLNRRGRPNRQLTAHLMKQVACNPDATTEPAAQSTLEELVFDGLVSRGVRGLVRQFKPPWYDGLRGVVDMAEPIGKTIVEADGLRWHSTDDAVENDHVRDRKAAAHDFLTIRLGRREVTESPDRSLGEAAEIIKARQRAALADT